MHNIYDVNMLNAIYMFSSMSEKKTPGALLPLMAQLGEEVSPKVYPAMFKYDNILGMYTLEQARRQGRGAFTPDMIRIGGLVTTKNTAPLHGTVEVFDQLPPKIPTPNVPFQNIQRLCTDGETWKALIPVGDGWEVRETFTIKPSSRSSARFFEVPSLEMIQLIEFLRRALVRWDRRNHPEVLADYLATFARVEVERLLREDSGKLKAFGDALQQAVGLDMGQSSSADPHGLLRPLAEMKVACSMLEMVGTKWPSVQGSEENASSKVLREWVTWPDQLSPAMEQLLDMVPAMVMNEAKEGGVNPEDHSDSTHGAAADRRLVRFCLAFWKNLTGSTRNLEGFTAEHAYSVDDQVGDALEACPKLDGHIFIADPNVGIGDYLVAAVQQMPDTVRHLTLAGCESNPFGLQVARLRLAVVRNQLSKGGMVVNSAVHLHNTFRDGLPMEILSTNHTGMVIGEWRPHINKDMKLDLGAEYAYHGWGAKMKGGDLAVYRCLTIAQVVLANGGAQVASVRVQASWAESPDADLAQVREKIIKQAGDLYVTTSGLKERPKDQRMVWGDITLLVSAPGGALAATPKGYNPVTPRRETRFSLLPDAAYLEWPSLRDIASQPPMNGPVERRGLALIDMDQEPLKKRLRLYFNQDASDYEVERKCSALMAGENRKGFDPVAVRRELLEKTKFMESHIARFSYRPFDDRYLYSRNLKPLFSEPAESLFECVNRNNFFFVASTGMTKENGGAPAWFGQHPCDYDFFAGHSGHFPVLLKGNDKDSRHIANLSVKMRDYLAWLGYDDPDKSRDAALVLWRHALAVLYAPAYQRENAAMLRHGYPRIPLPGKTDKRPNSSARELLDVSAALGRRITDLLDPKQQADSPDLKDMAILTDGRNDLYKLPSYSLNALSVTANWGTFGKWGAIRPRRGKVEGSKEVLTNVEDRGHQHFSGHMVDVYLNEWVYWTGIPKVVWEYSIGGRQVLPKWLSYRQEHDPLKKNKPILGRPLTLDEAKHFTDTARRLAQLVLLGEELDQSWSRLKG